MTRTILLFFLLLSKKIRTSKMGLFYSSTLVILGFIGNRMTAITSMEHWPGRTYIPSWQELMVTLGLVAFSFVAFSFVARYFKVFGEEAHVQASPTVETEHVTALGSVPKGNEKSTS